MQPLAPGGQYTPDGRWYWDGRQWIAITVLGPPWARPYAPPEGQAAAAVAMLALASAAAALGLPIVTLNLITTLATAPGLRVALLRVALPSLVALVVQLLGLVGAAIAVPVWMHRAFRNLPALGERGMVWSPGWAAGGWFVPFANLVIPYLCLRELWKRFGDERLLPQLYWAACIGSYVLLILGDVFFRTGARALWYLSELLLSVAMIVAGFLIITMVRCISRRQRDRQTELRDR